LPANQLTVGIVNDSNSPSHCGFTVDEGLAAWHELTDWVNGGPQPSPLDLELNCLATAADEVDCNYDPSLSVFTALPSFKRHNAVAVTGNNSYDSTSGELYLQSLQLLGTDTTYDLVCNPRQRAVHCLPSRASTKLARRQSGNTARHSMRISLFFMFRALICSTYPHPITTNTMSICDLRMTAMSTGWNLSNLK